MSAVHDVEHEPSLLEPRNPLARPGPIPNVRIENFVQEDATVVRRQPTTNGVYSAPTHTCGPKDTTGVCERYTSSNDTTTLPVVLGVVLPLTIALLIFIILHRRHVKKLRQEDADDKHKSLDFGMSEGVLADKKRQNRKSNKPVPEMSFDDAKRAMAHGRGLSIDLDMANPYILPPGLQQSRESLHSLSRSINHEDDRYRPATTFIPNDGSRSYPSSLRSPADDSSSFTGSSHRRFDTESNRVLLKNAHRVSRSGPPTRPGSVRSAGPEGRKPLTPIINNRLMPGAADSGRESYMSTGMNSAIRASNNYLGAYIRAGDSESAVGEEKDRRPVTSVSEYTPSSTNPGASSNELRGPPAAVIKDEATDHRSLHDQVPVTPRDVKLRGGNLDVSEQPSQTSTVEPDSGRQPRLPQLNFMESQRFSHDFRLPEINMTGAEQRHQEAKAPPAPPKDSEQSSAKSTLSPSTPHDHNSAQEDEEDMYDVVDYEDDLGYDPRRLTMGMRPLPPDDPSENPEQRANRIRSFYKEYFDESKSPNPQPAAAVEYFDGSENYVDDYYDEPQYDPMPPPPRGPRAYAGSERHRATFSTGSFQSGPRAYSSASGQFGGQGPQAQPKRKLPPPKPLAVLPTPHKLKDDMFLPIDFAPPVTYKERRAGTPDSLRGQGFRPYSPGVKAANPLMSSFDDLAVMPSPHALRKSATFTGLDFAPPPRFGRGERSGSDSGSIRSNGSSMSAVQQRNIRAGAYRVSRIPKEVAGTKDEMANTLRPQWDMRNM